MRESRRDANNEPAPLTGSMDSNKRMDCVYCL